MCSAPLLSTDKLYQLGLDDIEADYAAWLAGIDLASLTDEEKELVEDFQLCLSNAKKYLESHTAQARPPFSLDPLYADPSMGELIYRTLAEAIVSPIEVERAIQATSAPDTIAAKNGLPTLAFMKKMLVPFIQKQLQAEVDFIDSIFGEVFARLQSGTIALSASTVPGLAFGPVASSDLKTPIVLGVSVLVWRDLIAPTLQDELGSIDISELGPNERAEKVASTLLAREVHQEIRRVAVQSGLTERLAHQLASYLIQSSCEVSLPLMGIQPDEEQKDRER
jgi:hypothetical protein